jgi:hypothetical protein
MAARGSYPGRPSYFCLIPILFCIQFDQFQAVTGNNILRVSFSNQNCSLHGNNMLWIGNTVGVDRRKRMQPRQLRRTGHAADALQFNLLLLGRRHAIHNLQKDLPGRFLVRNGIGNPRPSSRQT